MYNVVRQINKPLTGQPPKALASSNAKAAKFSLHLLALIAGFVAAQKLNFGGDIYIGEILAFFYILININNLKIGKSLRPLLLLGFVWATCQLISDQVNQIAALDSVKGVGAPLVFVCTFTALSMFFVRDIRRMPSFLLGIYIGFIPEFVFFQSEYFLGNPWKWGIGHFVLGLFAVYFSFFKARKSVIYLSIFVVAFSIFSLINDSRSMAIFPIFALIAYAFLQGRYFRVGLSVFKGRFGIAKLAVVVFALLFSINAAFTAFFSSSWVLAQLPEDSAKKFKMQASGEYGILLGGRNEMLVSLSAFSDAPLLGHGSWAKDKAGYLDKLTALKYKLGYSDLDTETYSTDLIPAHSYMVGALVWAGIGGGLFWLFMLRWLLMQLVIYSRELEFYFYNGIVALLWDIMFSPFGASARWSTAVFAASLYGFSFWISKNKGFK